MKHSRVDSVDVLDHESPEELEDVSETGEGLFQDVHMVMTLVE